jgi:hypothetical protein
MQLCPKCRKEIRYIPVKYDEVIVCDDELTTVYTERGRRVEGYQPHKCKELNNAKSEENNNG